ncbi:MAG: hypothetical protein Q8M01_11910 [Rubrivivax sp.]|nr:hypothetical protein [Rubrivivax sp.]
MTAQHKPGSDMATTLKCTQASANLSEVRIHRAPTWRASQVEDLKAAVAAADAGDFADGRDVERALSRYNLAGRVAPAPDACQGSKLDQS